MNPKIKFLFAAVALGVLIIAESAFAQGTAFTYQGRLNSGGTPASGSYDLTFALFSDSNAVNQVSGTLTNTSVGVTNGLFTVNLDFGLGVITGQSLWLRIGVETNGGGGFATLSPLQELTPAPYAIYSATANSATSAGLASSVVAGSVTGAGIASGSVVKSLNGLHDAVTLAAGANVTITPSGNTLTIASSGGGGGGGSNAWSLTGNAGTSPASGNFLGTTDNNPLELHVNGLRALRLEPDGSGVDAPNVIGGSQFNSVSSGVFGAVIAGGGAANYFGNPDPNTVAEIYGFIGGGFGNAIQPGSAGSVINGGVQNMILSSSQESTIGGGNVNTIEANAQNSTIGGGQINTIGANATYATVGGGYQNTLQTGAVGSTIGGGYGNGSGGIYGAVGGGYENSASGNYTVVGGGSHNQAQGDYSFVGGGVQNQATGSGSVIGGGGYDGTIISPNSARGNASTIGGGLENATFVDYATISGGERNGVDGEYGAVGGGYDNRADGQNSTVAGGYDNMAGGAFATIAGGYSNTTSLAEYCTISGGGGNYIIGNFATSATIAGGFENNISVDGNGATISGGEGNTNTGDYGTISGGFGNEVNSTYATVPGGYGNNANGQASFAAGQNATANNHNSFVWGDGSRAAFDSAPSQFDVLATGGAFFYTSASGTSIGMDSSSDLDFGTTVRQMLNLFNTPGAANNYGIGIQTGTMYFRCGSDVSGTGFAWYRGGSPNSGSFDAGGGQTLMTLTTSGLTVNGTFVSASDRNLKENFSAVDSQAVLEKVGALPIQNWNYKADAATRHIGPMAQDFYSAFGVGPDDRHIAVVDEGGVALAAIQGLNEKLEARSQKLEAENAELKRQNEAMEQKLDALQKLVQEGLKRP